MHVNVYAEDIHDHLPVTIKTKHHDGRTYYGVELTLAGHENRLTIWSTSKDKLVDIFNGLAAMTALGTITGLMHLGEYGDGSTKADQVRYDAAIPGEKGRC